MRIIAIRSLALACSLVSVAQAGTDPSRARRNGFAELDVAESDGCNKAFIAAGVPVAIVVKDGVKQAGE